MNFVENVLASIVAGILLIVAGGFFSKTLRWILTSTLGHMLDIDTEFVFRTPREAASDIVRELRRASSIRLLTSRGNELQRETFADALGRKEKGIPVDFKILLPNVTLKPGEPDWTAQREAELANFDKAYGTGVLKKQVELNAAFLANYVTKGNIQLKLYNYPHIGRILLTDRFCYLTVYSKDEHGRDSRVIKYRHGGDTYEMLGRLFDQLWSAG